MSIRLATSADLPQLVDLEALLFENSLASSAFGRELVTGQCFVLGDPIYAYALVRVQPEITDLLRLGVRATEQGQGHGRRLLNHVLALGHTTMLTVLKSNTPALRLYLSAGFAIAGEIRADGKAGWVMLRRA